jgi:hypothetical protein
MNTTTMPFKRYTLQYSFPTWWLKILCTMTGWRHERVSGPGHTSNSTEWSPSRGADSRSHSQGVPRLLQIPKVRYRDHKKHYSNNSNRASYSPHVVPRSRMVELYLHSPYIFMVWYLIKHRDNSTCTEENEFTQGATLLSCIWEVPRSNIGQDTNYPD